MRIATWNILADPYIRPAYYPGVDPVHLEPAARLSRVVACAVADQADILCLQEVTPAAFEALRAALPDRAAAYQPKARGKPDGLALFVRGSVQHLPAVVFDAGTGGQVAQLARVAGLRVVNVHFQFDPPGHDAGVRQGRQLFAALADGEPTVVCGDFNAGVRSVLVGTYTANDTANGFVDACADAPADTCLANGHAARIDFVLVRGASVLAVDPVAAIRGPIPDADQPSDHLRVGVALRMDA